MLTFSTLNDRGLALIGCRYFKAEIYNYIDNSQKDFIEEWKLIDESASNAMRVFKSCFITICFIWRAKENDRNTTTPGIRKYYSQNQSNYIKVTY